MREGSARLSPCGTYRYELTRELGGARPLVICGLNPSTADATIDDATIRKDIGFARRWGYGRVVKVNAYAYRATDPKVMQRAAKSGVDIVGPENNWSLVSAARLAKEHGGLFVVAWGANIDKHRQHDVRAMLSDVDLWCLGVNGNGTPVHELYIPYDRELMRWDAANENAQHPHAPTQLDHELAAAVMAAPRSNK